MQPKRRTAGSHVRPGVEPLYHPSTRTDALLYLL